MYTHPIRSKKVEELTIANREASPLLQQCMTLLGQEELFQSSADVLLEAMQQPSYGKYLSFRDALLQCFTSNGMRAKFAECITGMTIYIYGDHLFTTWA